MNARTPHPPAGPSRRAALTGLATGAGSLTLNGTTPAAAAVPAEGAASRVPAPQATELFTDPWLDFTGLRALGAAGMGASEVDEVLGAVHTVDAAGPSEQSCTDSFRSWGERLSSARPPAAAAPGPLADPPVPLAARRAVARPGRHRQPQQMYDLLRGRRAYVKMTQATGNAA